MSCCRRNRRCARNDNWQNSCRNRCCNTMDNNMYNNNSFRNRECCSANEAGFPENYMLAHAYTPNQVMNKTFTPEMALRNGTLFPELVSPYYPGQSMDFIEYLKNDDGRGGCGCE